MDMIFNFVIDYIYEMNNQFIFNFIGNLMSKEKIQILVMKYQNLLKKNIQIL